jgi:competence protein ComEC
MTAIDVGQGDSILLEMPGGQKVLIDGGGKEQPFDSPSTRYASTSSAQAARSGFAQGKGPDAYEEDKTGSNIVVPFLHSKGINELDMVILSHPHDDHCGGLVSVLQKMKVDSVLDSGQSADTYNYRMFLSLIKQNHIKYDLGRAGQILNFGDVKGYVVWPMDPLLEGTSSDPNNNSIVIRFVYGRTSFLLPGDLGPEGESALLAQNWNLSSDVLKIGHHGSSTSSSPEFLDAVSPRYAVMSVGANNRYHLPSEKTLQRFEERGIPIYRTDMNGAVMVSSDGNNIDVHTAK